MSREYTEEDKKALLDIVEGTGSARNKLLSERVVPEDYKNFLNLTEREEKILTFPDCRTPVRVIITRAKDRMIPCPVHINMHGGGFLIRQNADDDMYCAHIAAGIRGIVVDIDYTTSDTAPFPEAAHQCWDVAGWVFSQLDSWQGDRERVSLGGNSAGGNLSESILIRNTKEKKYCFSSVILEYAASDNYRAADPARGTPTADADRRVMAFSMLYCGGNVDLLKDPECSPVFAADEELTGWPYVCFIAAGQCPFTEINQKLAERLRKLGNTVQEEMFAESTHGFAVRLHGQWRQAQEKVIEVLRAH